MALTFVEGLAAMHLRDPPAGGAVPVPAAPVGQRWLVMRADGLGVVGQAYDVEGLRGYVDDGKALVRDGGRSVLLQLQGAALLLGDPGGGAAAAAAAAIAGEDVCTLPVHGKGERRQRAFAGAVDLMEHHNLGDSELEGEASCLWYLEKIVQTGLIQVAGSGAWVSDSGVAAGDRSTYEHYVLAKVIQVACEKDQLNVASLESFELLARRALVIESAHGYNPASPDCTHVNDVMCWGVQKGGAFASPALTKHAASRAAERSSIFTEERKYAEEMRLRRPTPKAKGTEKGGAGNDKGAAPPGGGGPKK